jgi:hypothetical protein
MDAVVVPRRNNLAWLRVELSTDSIALDVVFEALPSALQFRARVGSA